MRRGPFTVVRRRCCNCGKSMGIQVWRWSDRLVLESHGYCSTCYERLREPTENGSQAPKTNSGEAARPAGGRRRG